MWVAVIATLVLVGFMLWVAALLDLIRATDMDPTARMILAIAVIFAAPLGVLLWLFVRGGRLGALVAVSVVALTAGLVISVAAGATASHGPVQVVQQSVTGGFGGSVNTGHDGSP
ncbi:MAG TPA: hypothetical protein VN193_09070 [Candidatus Angelobacter sp.]|jgi:hypothetical protein|nr:hypothetical protein [Candidatus Angelobacter sp.]